MHRVENESPPFDFWPYFELIQESHFEGLCFSEGSVNHVWRTADGRFEHVLVNCREDKDVYVVLILDNREDTVFGHTLLDLNVEYGIDPA